MQFSFSAALEFSVTPLPEHSPHGAVVSVAYIYCALNGILNCDGSKIRFIYLFFSLIRNFIQCLLVNSSTAVKQITPTFPLLHGRVCLFSSGLYKNRNTCCVYLLWLNSKANAFMASLH